MQDPALHPLVDAGGRDLAAASSHRGGSGGRHYARILLEPSLGHRAIALIYLFAVVVLASFVGRGPTLMAAAMSALLWDYFFMVPIHTFRITHFEDALLLGMYFVVALVLGQLTARICAQEKARRQGEEQATALYLLTRLIRSRRMTWDQMRSQQVVQRMGARFQGPNCRAVAGRGQSVAAAAASGRHVLSHR